MSSAMRRGIACRKESTDMNSSQHRHSQVSMNIEQRITSVAGGASVYGVYIDKLSILGHAVADRPGEASVLAYLTQAGKPPPPVLETNDLQRALWDVPVAARAGDFGADSEDLWDAIQNTFAGQSPERFIQRVLVLGEAGMGRTPALLQLQSKVAAQSMTRLQDYLEKTDQVKGSKSKQRVAWRRDDYVLPFYISLGRIVAGYDLPALIRDRYNAHIAGYLREHQIQASAQDTVPDALEPADLEELARYERESTPGPEGTIVPITLEQVPALLERYVCLFLLDDLELILTSNLLGAVEALNHFMENYPHQYVIACRTSSNWQQLGPIARLYLAEFPKQEAIELLGEKRYQWLSARDPNLVRNRASLHEILGRPESEVFEQSTGLLVQQDIRGRLRDHVDALRQHRLHPQLVERLLERLALTMVLDDVSTLDERQAMKVITDYLHEWQEPHHWRDVLATLNEAEMLQCDERLRRWSFRHPRAQAYFAAAALAVDTGQLQTVLAQVSDYRWRPVLELLTGLLSDPSEFIFDLIDRDALVAALCADAAGKSVNPRITSAVIDALLERMKQENSLRRQSIVERIGKSGHPRALETLLLALRQEWSSKVLMSIIFSMREWCESYPQISIADTEARLMHSSPRQHRAVADVLVACQTCWSFKTRKQRQQAIDELGRILLDVQRPRLDRGIAAIGLGIADTNETRALLLDLIKQEDADDFVAWCCIEALGLLSMSKDVEAVVIAFCDDEGYQDESWARHRARAVYLLGRMRQDDMTANRLLKALQDPSPLVRSCAVESLAQMDLRTGIARRQIELLLETESDPVVVRNIAEALGHIGVLSTIARLRPYLRHEVARTRWAAQRAIDEILARHAG
jgi:HEAT repeat protein